MPLTNPTSPVAPPAPAAPQAQVRQPEPRIYPRLLYQYSDVYPGFIYLKVESAEQEAAVIAGDQSAIAAAKQSQQQPPPPAGTQPPPPAGAHPAAAPGDEASKPPVDDKGWYDSPDEARYARARAHLPYVEFGRDIGGPVTWPPGTTEAMKGAAAAAFAPPGGRSEEPPGPPYPKLKYQAIDEPPGFKYVKMTNSNDDLALEGSGSGTWYDTPADAIAHPPAREKAAQGQRPTQTSLESQPGPAMPEGKGGPSVPQPHADSAKDAKDAKDAKNDEPPLLKKNGGKH